MGVVEIIKNFIVIIIDCVKILFSVKIDINESISISYGELFFLGIAIILLIYLVIYAISPKKEG